MLDDTQAAPGIVSGDLKIGCPGTKSTAGPSGTVSENVKSVRRVCAPAHSSPSANPPRPRRVCARCRRAPTRSRGQRYCRRCHAAFTRSYRTRHERELARLKQLWAESKRDDRFTRKKFEKRLGKTRRVLVFGIKDRNILAACVEVVRFCPENEVEVRIVATGELMTFRLNQIVRYSPELEIQGARRLLALQNRTGETTRATLLKTEPFRR